MGEATSSERGWTLGKAWVMGRLAGLAGILASIFVSGVVGFFSAQYALEGRVSEGQAVFTNIGLRYFDALSTAYDIDPDNPTTASASKEPRKWTAYRKALDSIEDDIRWLRTNPFYKRIPSEIAVATLQNRLIREATEDDCMANNDTLHLICRIFVESGELEKTMREGGLTETYKFAVINCKKLRQTYPPNASLLVSFRETQPPRNNCNPVGPRSQ